MGNHSTPRGGTLGYAVSLFLEAARFSRRVNPGRIPNDSDWLVFLALASITLRFR